MNRKKQAGKPAKGSAQKKVDWKALEIVHPDAAGIDVGGSEHWVAISPDRDPEPVRRFGCFTADLREMAGATSGPMIVCGWSVAGFPPLARLDLQWGLRPWRSAL